MSNTLTTEERLSQVPALRLLQSLGYTYLSPAEVAKERMGKQGNVLLENILRRQLRAINSIHHKGAEYSFGDDAIHSAVQKLKSYRYDGLVRTNEVIYDLLTLGTSEEQLIDGYGRSYNMVYVDWKHPQRNTFHVADEFAVERARSSDTRRPDLVLFVNGIPFCVIECKAPEHDAAKAVEQLLGYQHDDAIPHLFVYAQLLVAVNKNSALYGTVGTPKKFWSVWKEQEYTDADVHRAVNHGQHDERAVTEQDRALYALCHPERLLDIAYRYTLFDAGVKKVARYQQFFVIRAAMERIRSIHPDGHRRGGIIWHTQGSGKSLTMVMLVRSIALSAEIANPRIVLVTDRDDLDRQLGNTFKACGLQAERAASGKHLLELISGGTAGIITTLVHKFDKALSIRGHIEHSPDMFILVDEAHRSQYKSMNARMQQMLPHACYIGFTGTPLLKEQKNSFAKFGGMISPHYSIAQAVDDGAVLPLLYEGRMVELQQNKQAVDLWFERHTRGLTPEQQADLKKKYAKANMLNKTEQVIYMQAFDIAAHYRDNWQGTGFKAQLVAPSRAAAVRFKTYLDDLGVSSEVVISGPDTRYSHEDIDDEPDDRVLLYWNKMMKRFGNEEEYNKQIISRFKNGDHPEILIVKDKLLTGFDAPRNTVLYLCRTLREHTLLQAIARVNRLHDKKDFGYVVDYANVLGELDTALGMYAAFDGFAPEDVQGTLHDIQTEIRKLPQLHSHLWDIFKTVANHDDDEQMERHLADDKLRHDFYRRLTAFGKCLGIALSSRHYAEQTDRREQETYSRDAKRFSILRKSVKLRYAETIDYGEYEPRIEKMLDTHIQANEVYKLNDPVNIFDSAAFSLVKDERGIYESKSAAARADMIAHAVKKTITERMDQDPALYQKFSAMIQDAIDDFRRQRISDMQYLDAVSDIRHRLVNQKNDDTPERLSASADARAYYGVALPFFADNTAGVAIATELALEVERLFREHTIVNFWHNEEALKKVEDGIEDFLFDVVRNTFGANLREDSLDDLLQKLITVARHRSAH